MTPRCDVNLERLLAYRLGELGPAEEGELEAHLFECEECSQRARWLIPVEHDLKRLFHAGQLSTGASAHLVEHAAACGLTLRTYVIEPGESVACTAAPDDDLIVVRLRLGAREGESVDLDVDTRLLLPDEDEAVSRVLEDATLDVDSGELVYLFSAAYVRGMPRSQWVMRARVQGPQGTREVGPYTMDHTPWEQPSDGPGPT